MLYPKENYITLIMFSSHMIAQSNTNILGSIYQSVQVKHYWKVCLHYRPYDLEKCQFLGNIHNNDAGPEIIIAVASDVLDENQTKISRATTLLANQNFFEYVDR